MPGYASKSVDLKEFGHNRGWFLALGIIMIILGAFALGSSMMVTLFSMLFLGWLLLFTGVYEAVQSFWERHWGGFFLHLALGILYVVVGLMLVARPGVGALALTLLMAMFFMVAGIFRIIMALAMRFPQWGWMLFNGIVTLILGVLIWAQWPVSALWIIGLFIGIDLIFTGCAWVMLSLAAGRVSAAAGEGQ
jgi:uncharacterized membrane protein HdeD (DUF308 family)